MAKVVLGGGIGGLSAAHYLLKKHPQHPVTLVEASGRLGGWIKSTKQPDGTIFEQGPRTVRPRGVPGSVTLNLIEELNLASKIIPIPSTHPAASKRLVYANNQLHLLPSSITGLLKKQTPFSKPLAMYFLQEMFKPATKVSNNDESIYSFFNRRFGQELSDYLISPMICGICAGDAKEISVKFLVESLFDLEQKYGSISVGIVSNFFQKTKKPIIENGSLVKRAKNEKWSIYTFVDGIETLPKALHESLNENKCNTLTDTRCIDINFNNKVELMLSNGTVLDAEHVVSSIPAKLLSPLVQKQHPSLSALLNNIESVSVAIINLKYEGQILPHEGFGFLVAPKENLPILGVIYDSCCTSNKENTILTIMMGGHWFKQHFGENPTEAFLYDTAMPHVNKILNIKTSPVNHKITILKNCIPQYKVGHKANLQKIEKYIAEKQLKLQLCGSSYYGVGINDVILSSRNAIDKI